MITVNRYVSTAPLIKTMPLTGTSHATKPVCVSGWVGGRNLKNTQDIGVGV